MEKSKKKIKCPKCGSEMNHHADKIIYSDSENKSKYFDEDLDGILEEHHKCPNCGATLSILEKERE
ncbi:MAG: hypothetical protein ABI550_07100 [Ignavibacteriaceae bacterium]